MENKGLVEERTQIREGEKLENHEPIVAEAFPLLPSQSAAFGF